MEIQHRTHTLSLSLARWLLNKSSKQRQRSLPETVPSKLYVFRAHTHKQKCQNVVWVRGKKVDEKCTSKPNKTWPTRRISSDRSAGMKRLSEVLRETHNFGVSHIIRNGSTVAREKKKVDSFEGKNLVYLQLKLLCNRRSMSAGCSKFYLLGCCWARVEMNEKEGNKM